MSLNLGASSIFRVLFPKMTSLLDKVLPYGPKTKVHTKDQAERSVVVQHIPPESSEGLPVDLIVCFVLSGPFLLRRI